MKRLFFSLAFVLAATFSYANENSAGSCTADAMEIFSSVTGGAESMQPVVADCTIKGTITIIFNDGSKMTLKDANITFVGVSCIQLLKQLASAS